jgi:hypothetical protein
MLKLDYEYYKKIEELKKNIKRGSEEDGQALNKKGSCRKMAS